MTTCKALSSEQKVKFKSWVKAHPRGTWCDLYFVKRDCARTCCLIVFDRRKWSEISGRNLQRKSKIMGLCCRRWKRTSCSKRTLQKEHIWICSSGKRILVIVFASAAGIAQSVMIIVHKNNTGHKQRQSCIVRLLPVRNFGFISGIVWQSIWR